MVIGALTVIILILIVSILLIVVRNQRAKQDCTNKVRNVFLKHNNTRIFLAYRPAWLNVLISGCGSVVAGLGTI